MAVRATEATSIEVGSQSGHEFDLSSESEGGNATASFASSIASATYERGRRYPVFGDVQYPMPIDDLEQNREDMKHATLMMLTENKLFLAPIGDHSQKILDIGTGTGTWAIEGLLLRACITGLLAPFLNIPDKFYW
ncbi:hypothetical protein E4U19_003245 [Claviceps sp. Clav32 group G5]|nr:hypothetical protein E4U19_003245 [Claviceps sp. Clav32 group G5]